MNAPLRFPLYSSKKQCDTKKDKKILVVDLRRELSCIAQYSCVDNKISREFDKKYATRDFSSFTDMLDAFLQTSASNEHYSSISVAVPGPVINDKCITANLPWEVNQKIIIEHTGVQEVFLINDLEATAYSLGNFHQDRLHILHTSDDKIKGNMCILAPGKGLGEAGLFWDGEQLRPFATEGGHTEFSPRNDFEVQFYQFLNKIYGLVTWETVLSERGIYDIYRFLRDIGRHREEAELAERIKNENFIDVLASVGEAKTSRLVKLTLELYSEFLAREANNLVLKLKSVGGLIITGNIPNKLFYLIDFKEFYKNFLISDKMENLLSDVPIYWLNTDESILDGAAYYSATH